MESSFGGAESDVYRMEEEEEPSDVFSSDDSGGPADADGGNDSFGLGPGRGDSSGRFQSRPAAETSTVPGDRRVTFERTPGGDAPKHREEGGTNNGMNFRHVGGAYSPFPTQSLRARPGEASSEYTHFARGGDPFFSGGSDAETPHASNRQRDAPGRPEETPAFIRRAAMPMDDPWAESKSGGGRGSVPPSSLARTREQERPQAPAAMMQDSSFLLGADASALDGTFVSVRDLDGDDDVPPVDRWGASPPRSDADGSFPTESTSLLGGDHNNGGGMSWQGGFFGSRLEREDRRERTRLARARRRGAVEGWLGAVRAALGGGDGSQGRQRTSGGSAHPSGSDFEHGRHRHRTSDRSRRSRRTFSRAMTASLCLHLGLCGLHDLFLIYVSYRTDDGSEASVSWNGEGRYVPPHWLSSDGRAMNPLLGPGARTLTAFGAHVPGLVLGGQWWRLATSLLGSSSLVQVALHVLALRTVVGGAVSGVERTRGALTVLSLYFFCGVIGAVWSIVLDPGRLVASSDMGMAGLLAASIVERQCFTVSTKDEGADLAPEHGASATNGVASSSNEQFSFQPAPAKKRRRPSLDEGSPTLLLLLGALMSYWGAYSSLLPVCLSALVGCALGLILFVGNPPRSSETRSEDLILEEEEEAPPPPPPPRWTDDDDDSDASAGGRLHGFDTPLMRRSILTDEDDDEPLGTRSTLRKRRGEPQDAPARYSPSASKERRRGGRHVRPFSASRTVARLVGTLLVVLLTLIPLSLVATGSGPSGSATNAAVLGCKPMMIVYASEEEEDGGGVSFECAGGCVPLSREKTARRDEGMRTGRCDEVGYRCWQQSGTLTLRNYDAAVGVYVTPSADGSCSEEDEEEEGEAAYAGNDGVQGEGGGQ